MKIERATIENFKGIKIVDISLDKNMILITGQNGSGKSSFLDGIMTALSNKDKSIVKPVRDGEDKAMMKILLDGYTITRIITDKTNRLEIVSSSGDIKKSPQEWLNEHIGNLKFDPIEFAKMDEKKQRQVLIDLAGLNLEEQDKIIKDVYEERQLLSREIAKMPKPEENDAKRSMVIGTRDEINITELSEKYAEESKKNVAMNDAKKEIDRCIERIKECGDEQERLAQEQKELHEKIEKLSSTPNSYSENELKELKNELSAAEITNADIRRAKMILNQWNSFQEKNKEHDTLTAKLEEQRDIKKQLLEAAEFPIEGLTIDDEGVFYNKIPFSQLSSSQQIVIGTMIAIELIPENGVRLIIIREGSLLDNKALSFLEKISVDKNVQFLIEYVTDDEKKGIYIEEGEVK